MTTELNIGIFILATLGGIAATNYYRSLSIEQAILFVAAAVIAVAAVIAIAWNYFSKSGRDRRSRIEEILQIPPSLIVPASDCVYVGEDRDLSIPVFLPDSVRFRHVHILGATGSGKTESVVLNFLRQDVARGLGAIILDAKGDASFIRELRKWVPEDRLKIFDLSSAKSIPYSPLDAGNSFEAAQRLFSSFTWSEEYYKSKALSTLQRLFEVHQRKFHKNPVLNDLCDYLDSPDSYASALESESYPKKLAEKDFQDLSGLKDQLRGLTIGYLKDILSPGDEAGPRIVLEDAKQGAVIYFRLQSLLSKQLMSTVGKLVINHLSHIAGTAHRDDTGDAKPRLLPTYLDEFASFACPEFADLISKARSAGLALHFSHQSVGDFAELPAGFMTQITDNSATKIVLRIADPDSAELMSRTFGTRLYQKITQRITNVEEIDTAEVVGEGTQREAHQFRAAPDLLKTLPTGVGSVLIAHGEDVEAGASTVFKVKFPRLGDALPSAIKS